MSARNAEPDLNSARILLKRVQRHSTLFRALRRGYPWFSRPECPGACVLDEARPAGGTAKTVAVWGLTCLHRTYIIMHMRTTLNIDDALLRDAQRLSGIREKTALIHHALQMLIARESAKRLAALGGTERRLKPIPRRRPWTDR